MNAIKDAHGLLNQYALDPSGALIHATQCADGLVYRCPLVGCAREIRVRASQSEQVRAHLYHSDGCGASGESHEHNLAKRLVEQRLLLWLSGDAPPPFFARRCSDIGCGYISDEQPDFTLATRAGTEIRVGERIADVLVLRQLRPILAIEIHYKHAVDEAKAIDLKKAGVPWIELEALDVLERRPWTFVRGSMRRTPCPVCTSQARKYQAMADRAKADEARSQAMAATEKARVQMAQARQSYNHIQAETDALRVRRDEFSRLAAVAFDSFEAAKSITKKKIDALDPKCERCGLRLPDGQTTETHRLSGDQFSALYPNEKDLYREAHMKQSEAAA